MQTFFGLSLQVRYDVILLLVEQHLSRGITIQIDIKDDAGMPPRIQRLNAVDSVKDISGDGT